MIIGPADSLLPEAATYPLVSSKFGVYVWMGFKVIVSQNFHVQKQYDRQIANKLLLQPID